MKKSVNVNLGLLSLLVGLVLFIASCKKDSNKVIDASDNPEAQSLVPARAAGRELLTLNGQNIGQITSVIFEKDNVPAAFNPNFNTATAFLFRVPDTASGGPQNIIFTNSLGKTFKVPFDVIALPSVTDVSNYDFETGTTLTLVGINLEGVTKVVLTASPTTNVTIVSKTKKQLVVSMPATSLYRSKLDITNATGTISTTQEFVSLTNNFKFFSEGYDNGEQDASWGDAGIVSNTQSKSGTKSFGKNFQGGNWSQMGFGWNNISNDNYTYLTFYMKGGSVDLPIWVFTNQSPDGNGPFAQDAQKIIVPANVWTYFKMPISAIKPWANGTAFNQIGWRIKGPGGDQLGGANELMYLDDVMLVK
jgi:hypothetical protein